MESRETKNPLRAGKVIGPVTRKSYSGQIVSRGHGEFVMSRGELVEFNRCPHRWLKGIESEETKSTEWGSLIDCLLLTPGRFEDEFAVAPEKYPATPRKNGDPIVMKPWNRNATYCAEWEDSQGALQIVKHEQRTAAEQAIGALLADQQIADLVECSQKQIMVIAEYYDEETGITVPLKTLLDLLPGDPFQNSLADLKTCVSAHPGPWKRAVYEHGYHVQAAMYRDAYFAATQDERPDFLHILQESYPPYEVGKRLLSAEFLDLGRNHYVAALQRYCRCLKDNHWPGYDEGNPLVLNGWTLVEPEPWMLAI